MALDVVEGAIGAEGDSMEQLTIFDLLPGESTFGNQIIDELVEDLKRMFPSINIESYHTWSHVPNLGKRLWSYVEHFPEDEDFEWLCEKYKEKHLEISINIVPRFDDMNTFSAYISTLWKTKGHKEI